MQVGHDYSITGSPKKLERACFGIKFTGPGFYLTNTDTVLIIPLPPNEAATADNVWHVKQPKGTVYQAFVYNVTFNKTIFAACAAAPVRQDDRG